MDSAFGHTGRTDPNDMYGCTPAAEDKWGPCRFAGNVQSADRTAPDRRDVCFRLVGGAIGVHRVRDNACAKAGVGLYAMYVRNLEWADRAAVHRFNAPIRVRDNQRSNYGSDYLFRRIGSVTDIPCSHPACRDNAVDPLDALEVNANYALGVPHPRLVNVSHGFNTFHTIQEAVDWAPFALVGPLATNSTVWVTVTNGSSLAAEHIVVHRALTLRGDPRPCARCPVIIGCDHLLATWYVNMTCLEFWYGRCPAAGLPLWSTARESRRSGGVRPTTVSDAAALTPLYALLLTNITLDGRSVPNGDGVWALSIHLREPNGTFIARNCSAVNWNPLPPGTVRLPTLQYLNGGRPLSPHERDTAAELARLEAAGLLAPVQDVGGIMPPGVAERAHAGNDSVPWDSEFHDPPCDTTAEAQNRTTRVTTRRRCPGDNCEDYYQALFDAGEGRPTAVLETPDGRQVAVAAAPYASAVRVRFGDARTALTARILARSQADAEAADAAVARARAYASAKYDGSEDSSSEDDSSEDDSSEDSSSSSSSSSEDDSSSDDGLDSTDRAAARAQLDALRTLWISLGAFPPFVSDADLEVLVRTAWLDALSLGAPGGSDDPWTSAVRVGAALARTSVHVDGLACTNVSGACLSVEYPASANISRVDMVNTGMWAPDVPCGLCLTGRRDSGGTYSIAHSSFNNTLPGLFPQVRGAATTTAVAINPRSFAAFDVRSICGGGGGGASGRATLMFADNSAAVNVLNSTRGTVAFTTQGRVDGRRIVGALYGVRFSDICNATWLALLAASPGNYFPTYRPRLAPLRELVTQYGNTDLHGLVCDVVQCNPGWDATYRPDTPSPHCVCCADGCRVPPPPRCQVNPANDTFRHGNPYYGTYLFRSLVTAVVGCVSPSREIEVVALPDGGAYMEQQLVLRGPGGFVIVSPSGARLLTSGIRVEAPGLDLRDVVLEHEGRYATLVLDGVDALLASFALRNVTLRGGGTALPAVAGACANLTLVGVQLTGYVGRAVVNVTSPGGNAVLHTLSASNLPGCVVALSGLAGYTVVGCTFLDCGGRVPGVPAALHLVLADGAPGPVVFDDNAAYVSGEVGGALLEHPLPECAGWATTWWLDGLPLHGSYAVRNNKCGGLPVGLRLTRFRNVTTTDRTLGVGPMPALTLQRIVWLWDNSRVTGTRADIIAGQPCDDGATLAADPKAVHGRWCKGGCPVWGSPSIIAAALLITLALLVLLVLCWCECAAVLPLPVMTYSTVLQRHVPLSKQYRTDVADVVAARARQARARSSGAVVHKTNDWRT